MDTREAEVLIHDFVARLRHQSYGDLVARYLDKTEHRSIRGPSGADYQIEVQALWDDRQPGNMRVIVAIDDGGWSAIKPMSTDFIIAPDGSFVGE